MKDLPQRTRDPWIVRMQRLMPHRVREILLVSSRYDAFILEEDGPLTERLFSEYSELSLPWYPRILHAANGLEAMALLAERRIDLVLTTSRLGDTDVNTLSRTIKKLYPELPIVLLTFSAADLRNFPDGLDEAVDHVFLWSGDPRILLAIHKLVEDVLNAEHDAEVAGIPVIIVVEDSVRHYSTVLTLLYLELVQQAQSLVAEGVNNLHKVLRLRTRPKVLLATDYEEAMRLYRRFDQHVVAVVTDVRFEREGREDPEAGFHLVEAIRRDRPEIPILLASAEHENGVRAQVLRTHFVDKTAANLSKEIRRFVSESLGFGDFIFRMPDHTEIARARDTYEMEQILRTVRAEALHYHAARNHFSTWLRARGMFDLADLVRSRQLEEFEGVEDARAFLVDVVRRALMQEQEGMVTDFSSRQTKPASRVVRLGTGSIGGKARGVAFAASLLARKSGFEQFPDLEVRVPKTIIIGTDEFDRFMEMNGLVDLVRREDDDAKILARFLEADLPRDLLEDLLAVWETMPGPLAVRSSSLLEDLQFQPFAGVYATYMLPNGHPDRTIRFRELQRAIKAVYASTFSKSARTYVTSTAFNPEEEKMAVIIQEVVGQAHGERFYPHVSGVALSYNYYPVQGQRAEDGVALLALGLGHMVVHGGNVLRFTPRTPGVMPQFASVRDMLTQSQHAFYALDLSRQLVDFTAGFESSLKLYDLDAAEGDGTLALAASVYSADDEAIRDNLSIPGRRVITFNNILKWNAVPLAPVLDRLLSIIRSGMGSAVEIELAVDMGDLGRPRVPGADRVPPTLYVLQIRPIATQFLERHLEPARVPSERVLMRTDHALGHGIFGDIQDVVYVRPDALDHLESSEVAQQVGALDERLRAARAPYLLVGPGRWGTSDHRLGIPVQWSQIAGARIITETPLHGRAVEPSLGTHFFQNITSLGIGYLTVGTLDRPEGPGEAGGGPDFLDLDWLDAQPAVHDTGTVRHVRFERPMQAYLDGQRNRALVLKPGDASDEARGAA